MSNSLSFLAVAKEVGELGIGEGERESLHFRVNFGSLY